MTLKINLKNSKYCGKPYSFSCPCLDNSERTYGGFICRMGYRDASFLLRRELSVIRDKESHVKNIIRPKKCIEENGK